jgi:hypothetical protein
MNDAMLCDNDAISVSRMFPTASRERVSQIRLVECPFPTGTFASVAPLRGKGVAFGSADNSRRRYGNTAVIGATGR